jgi:hypothetical protein
MARVIQINESNAKLEGFDLFWSLYPRKVAKLDALKAWNQTKKLHPSIEEMIAAVNKMTLSTEKEWIPYPGTWLRSGRFLDEDV